MNRLSTSILLGLTSAAAASAQFNYQYSIDNGLTDPVDVAVYRECNQTPGYVFVADRGAGLVQYLGDGSANIIGATASNYYDQGPFGVAVDDSASSALKGQVYTTDHNLSNTFGLIWIHKDTSLIDTSLSITDGPTCMSVKWLDEDEVEQYLVEPKGIAADRHGNIYVADPTQNVVVKVAAADAAHQGEVCIEVTAELAFNTIWYQPQDVSVDKIGRMHVTHPCGCLAVFRPDGTLFGSGAIYSPPFVTGVDAKDDLLTTRSTGPGNVEGWAWDMQTEDHPQIEDFSALGTDPQGLEFQKFWFDGGGQFFCEDRLFVANPGLADEIVVFNKKMTSTPTPFGAVASWRFDGPQPLLDSVGSNHITLSGSTPPTGVDGKVRCGLEFHNQTAIVGLATVADDPSLDFGTGNFTVEGWICTELSSNTVAGFLDKRRLTGPTVDQDGFSMFLYNGHLGFQILNDGNAFNLHPANPQSFVADGKWHHVAATVQRTVTSQKRLRLYVDGQFTDHTLNPALGSVDNDWPLLLGDENNGYGGLMGMLDEFTIYNRELNSCEVQRIFHAGCAGKNLPSDIHNYCTGSTTSSGCLPVMDYSGTPSLSAGNFLLVAKFVPEDTWGTLMYSTAGTAQIPFLQSVWCIQPPIYRTGLVKSVGAGPCGGTLSFDLAAYANSGYGFDLQPGTEVWAQYMFRDPGGAGPPGLQPVPLLTTDAMHFTILP